jgi:osmotically-inducible protein OsmY
MKRISLLSCLLVAICYLSPVAIAANNDVSDAAIKAKIVTSYTLSPQLNPFDFDVKVNNGVAYIGGAVSNSVEKDLALDIAKSVDGVTRVEDHISTDKAIKKRVQKTEFAQKVEDAGITAAVKTKLLAKRSTSGTDIHVTTVNHVVTLEGVVDSAAEKELAGKLTAHTRGVRNVINNLQVRNS